jgi:predicted DNA-binding helix-hairpin-helix protein
MEAMDKLKLLSPPTRHEPCEEVIAAGLPALRQGQDVCRFIYQAVMPGGKRIALLKTLLTSACERNCAYCGVRQGRDFRRATFSPDELAGLFIQLYRQGLVEGIFLSSGIAGGGPRTQDRLIAAAEILRRRHAFRGYIHLKIMPGAERDQIEAAMRLADRVSVNLEAPNPERLASLCPRKDFSGELLLRLRWIEDIRQQREGGWPSSTTQFVIGAAGESDLEVLSTTEFLHERVGLARAYFSRFEPVPDTPLQDLPAAPAAREHRLYQCSFLLRDYGFGVEELPFDPKGNLPLDTDPKLAWAELNLSQSPVELNTAERQDLIRVPGIGPKGADRIQMARRERRLRDVSDLSRLGISAGRASPYVLLDGHRPARQLSLWAA